MDPLYKKYLNEVVNDKGEVVDFSFNVPEGFVFAYDVLDELARTKPDETAMLWANDHGEEHAFTFADMKEGSDKAAAIFASKGIGQGDVVMLILRRHYHFWFAIMGLNKLGAVAVPATNQLQVKDLEYRIKAASVKAIVCVDDGEIEGHVDTAQKNTDTLTLKWMSGGKRDGWMSFDEELAKDWDFQKPDLVRKNEDIMLLYFTSGTTGMPKMVAHDHEYPIAHIVTAKYWHNVRPGKPHLTISETGWAKSVWGKLYGQWFMEAVICVYDMERFNADSMLKYIEKYKVATFCCPPTIYRMLIQENLAHYDLSCIEYATTAGEALNPEVFNKFKKYTGLEIKEGFGQTETTLTLFTDTWLKPKPGSMGKPSKAYDIVLIDENCHPVKPGVVGEIAIKMGAKKPTGMFLGYYRDEELTRNAFRGGYYHTGDMAWADEEGYCYYVSRTDDVIKSSGYRIGPFEVESVVMEHDSVVECAVTGIPDPVRGMAVKATIILVKGYEPSEELKKDIQNYVKTHTAPYKYPRVIEFVEELPKTISGKIRRIEIREQDCKAQ